jgi:hypothetical protein
MRYMQQSIDIERLINEANDLTRTMQQHGVELKHEQLPISALVRCPLLALRWQLSDKKVHFLLHLQKNIIHTAYRSGVFNSSFRTAATMILPTAIFSSWAYG